MAGMTDGKNANSHDDARKAHLEAKQVLVDVRAGWGTETATAALPARLSDAAGEENISGLASLYVFAARVGGRQTDDPTVATKWLAGWSSARARVPDDGRAALDAGIAFATRLHDAMGITGSPE